MLKHVVAHRSSSSLGGTSSSASCSSFISTPSSAVLSCASTSSPPLSSSSFNSASSFPSMSLSASSRRGSLSSNEAKNRHIYRRTESYEPTSLPSYREVYEPSGQQHKNIGETCSRCENDPSFNSSIDLNTNHGTTQTTTGPENNNFNNSPSIPSQPSTDMENEDHHNQVNYRKNSAYRRSFVEMVNLLDSHPSLINDFDLEEQCNEPISCKFNRGTYQGCPKSIASLPQQVDHNKGYSSFSTKLLSNHKNVPSNEINNSSSQSLNTINSSLNNSRNSQHNNSRNSLSDNSKCVSNSNLSNMSRSSYSNSSTSTLTCVDQTNDMTSRSSTLPRRGEPKLDVRRSSFRSNSSACSLLSIVSCSSLNAGQSLASRSTSTSSLSDTIPVKIYLRRLRPDMEYKTVSLTSQTTCKELILSLLTKFRLRHRDPKLFFVLMEVTVRSPSDDAPVKRILVLDDNARPAELQQCRPKGESRFSVGVRRGGLVRVHDSILMPGSQYKSLMVSYNTNSDELVHLMLKCYNSLENPKNYALHEVCKNPYSDRPLNSDECPLMVQWEWPRNTRPNWAFVLRRNLTYAFSLKSRMSWRRSLDQSSTDTESEFDDHNITASSVLSTSSLSSVADSRSSSVSSTSSVSSACSSISSDSSLDSGYLGSPIYGTRIPSTNTPKIQGKLNSGNQETIQHMTLPSSKSVIPVTPSVSRLSLNSSKPNVNKYPPFSINSSSPYNPSAIGLPPRPRQKTIITITSTGRSTPVNPADTGQPIVSASPSIEKTVHISSFQEPTRTSSSGLQESKRTSTPPIATTTPSSSNSATRRQTMPSFSLSSKPNITTSTATVQTGPSSGNRDSDKFKPTNPPIELQRRLLRPIIPPPSLRIPPTISSLRIPSIMPSNTHFSSATNRPKINETDKVSSSISKNTSQSDVSNQTPIPILSASPSHYYPPAPPPSPLHCSQTTSPLPCSEKKFLEAIESLKSLSEGRLQEKGSSLL